MRNINDIYKDIGTNLLYDSFTTQLNTSPDPNLPQGPNPAELSLINQYMANVAPVQAQPLAVPNLGPSPYDKLLSEAGFTPKYIKPEAGSDEYQSKINDYYAKTYNELEGKVGEISKNLVDEFGNLQNNMLLKTAGVQSSTAEAAYMRQLLSDPRQTQQQLEIQNQANQQLTSEYNKLMVEANAKQTDVKKQAGELLNNIRNSQRQLYLDKQKLLAEDTRFKEDMKLKWATFDFDKAKSNDKRDMFNKEMQLKQVELDMKKNQFEQQMTWERYVLEQSKIK